MGELVLGGILLLVACVMWAANAAHRPHGARGAAGNFRNLREAPR